MLKRIELSDRDRRLAKRLRQELDGTQTLKACEETVQMVKECRHHGINPESILGPGMQTLIRLEQIECALEETERMR